MIIEKDIEKKVKNVDKKSIFPISFSKSNDQDNIFNEK
jgi:hypothetical protein